jgi:hypothetical protein
MRRNDSIPVAEIPRVLIFVLIASSSGGCMLFSPSSQELKKQRVVFLAEKIYADIKALPAVYSIQLLRP